MSNNVRITVLVNNTASRVDLIAEHGLSILIDYEGKQILFDTGQSNAVMSNAQKLGVDLACTDTIVISHGHYDHTGGLCAVLDTAPKAKIYLHPEAIQSRFSQKDLKAKYIGMSDSVKKAIGYHHITWTETHVNLFPGLTITGQIPRVDNFEDVGGAFFLDENCQKPDRLIDDQTLFIESSKGLVVILGCAHSGVVNILDYINKLTGREKIHAVIGGMHLLNAGQMRINKTIETLKKYDVQKVIPLHCTGQKVMEVLKNVFCDKCLLLGAGDKITF